MAVAEVANHATNSYIYTWKKSIRTSIRKFLVLGYSLRVAKENEKCKTVPNVTTTNTPAGKTVEATCLTGAINEELSVWDSL